MFNKSRCRSAGVTCYTMVGEGGGGCKPGYRVEGELCLINLDAGQHTGVTCYTLVGEGGGEAVNQDIERKENYV